MSIVSNNLKKIKPDTDTSMPKPSNFTPKKIKTYATLFGFLLGGLTIWKFVNWMIENQILIPVVISIGLICFILYTKHKKKVLKLFKFAKRVRRRYRRR